MLLNVTPFNEGNRFISNKDAPGYSGHSLGWLNQLTSRRRFPQKRTLDTRSGGKLTGWFSSEIDEWKNGKTQFIDRNVWSVMSDSIQRVLSGHVDASIRNHFELQVVEAIWELIPVMIRGQGGYEPSRGRFLMTGYGQDAWDTLPGYPADAFHSEIPGYQTWFTVFSDSYGTSVNFLYPVAPKIGEPITVITPVGCIHWVHGVEGLAAFAQVHYVEWLLCQMRQMETCSTVGDYPFFNIYQVLS